MLKAYLLGMVLLLNFEGAELIRHDAPAGAARPVLGSACSTLGRAWRLSLRGGNDQTREAESRMAATLVRLKGVTCELQKAVADDDEDNDVMGYTSWGDPLSMNPTNAVIYNPDEYSEESENAQEAFERKRERLAPTAESIKSALEKVEWIQNVADRLSPENVIAELEKRGQKLEDLQPRMNPSGTEMGNLTTILETRERMYAKIKQIHATKDKLVHEMSKKSPVEELNEEIAGMRERGEVNPYFSLLMPGTKNTDSSARAVPFNDKKRL